MRLWRGGWSFLFRGGGGGCRVVSEGYRVWFFVM